MSNVSAITMTRTCL